MRVAITGANGFVGTALCKELENRKIPYTAIVRSGKSQQLAPVLGCCFELTDYCDGEQLKSALAQSTTVVHLAARVKQAGADNFRRYLKDNVDLTRKVIESAHAQGIRHFVFLSTIEVYGEGKKQKDFTLTSRCSPTSAYGESKFQGELLAKELCKKYGISLDIVRIPVIVGSEAKGSLETATKLIKFGLPLPIGGISNRRSFVRLEALTSFLVTLCEQRSYAALPETWLHAVAEESPVTTPELIAQFAQEKGFQARFVTTPRFLIRLSCTVLDMVSGKRTAVPHAEKPTFEKVMSDAVLVPGSIQEN